MPGFCRHSRNNRKVLVSMKTNHAALILVLAIAGPLCAAADLSGRITDAAGAPVPGARVFVEPGIEGAVAEGAVGADGAFNIPGEFYGNTGVFGFAPGYGLSGTHLNISPGDRTSGLSIVLQRMTLISGRVENEKGEPIPGAVLSSLAIVHPVKVGIPLFKMKFTGMEPPVTDAEGRFAIGAIPEGGRVVLKFEHPSFAQEAVSDVAAGENDLKVTMYNGVSLRGTVSIRGSEQPVSGATVALRNAQPPHDTAFCTTDGSGAFQCLLKPGVFLAQAYAAGRISPGMQHVEVKGDMPQQHLRLNLSGKGVVEGSLKDAKTEKPIPGARVLLETQGQAAGATRTGADGRYRLDAPEGIYTLHFEAVDGYLPPDTRALKITVKAGETLELPGLWLAPTSDYVLRVVEQDGKTPVPGAFISLLWPRQFGWQRSDANGRVTIRFSSLPEDNRVIGMAEHPDKPQGALFALNQQNAANGRAALLPLGTVKGRVVNEKGEPLAGVTVGAMYADEKSPEALAVWRCVTGKDGRYAWPAAPAGVPQRCVASLGAVNAAGGRDFNPAPGESVDLGDITLPVKSMESGIRSQPTWTELPQVCGPALQSPLQTGLAAFHCRSDAAPVYLDACGVMREQLLPYKVQPVVVVGGFFACKNAAIPVLRGTVPESVTRLYDAKGALRLETVGLPPIVALRGLVTE